MMMMLLFLYLFFYNLDLTVPPFTFQNTNRLSSLLGRWKGHSITKRSGVYGATIAEAETLALLEIDDKGQLIQVCNASGLSTPLNHEKRPLPSTDLVITGC